MINPKDFIYIDSWEKLAAEFGFVYTATEHAPEVFGQVRGTGKKTVLVTACSDLGLSLQADEHPNADLYKMAVATDWNQACAHRDSYLKVEVGPTCVLEKCRNSHKYSLKTERFTWSTFDDIPDEIVRWYTTNLNIEHERIRPIPFGLNNDGLGVTVFPEFLNRPKTKLLYVNFQDNSLLRIQLKQRYANERWLTFRPQANLPVRDYLAELAEHEFVLCPPGNGLDCYRVWECLYLGCYPVMCDSIFARHLINMDLPVVVVDKPFHLSPGFLQYASEQMSNRKLCLTRATLSYWREQFEQTHLCCRV